VDFATLLFTSISFDLACRAVDRPYAALTCGVRRAAAAAGATRRVRGERGVAARPGAGATRAAAAPATRARRHPLLRYTYISAFFLFHEPFGVGVCLPSTREVAQYNLLFARKCLLVLGAGASIMCMDLLKLPWLP
jgi:hypothetical protein